MEGFLKIATYFVLRTHDFILQYQIPILFMMGFVGLITYAVGEGIRKKGLAAISQNQATDFPYKSVALSLNIMGVGFMIIAAILLYFAGGYDAAFIKLGLK